MWSLCLRGSFKLWRRFSPSQTTTRSQERCRLWLTIQKSAKNCNGASSDKNWRKKIISSHPSPKSQSTSDLTKFCSPKNKRRWLSRWWAGQKTLLKVLTFTFLQSWSNRERTMDSAQTSRNLSRSSKRNYKYSQSWKHRALTLTQTAIAESLILWSGQQVNSWLWLTGHCEFGTNRRSILRAKSSQASKAQRYLLIGNSCKTSTSMRVTTVEQQRCR